MNTAEINQLLAEVGLAPSEISVYTALLAGSESAQEIISATREKRPTVYYCLNSLEKRGLVSKTGKEYGNKFRIEPLNKLSALVEVNIKRQNELLIKTKKLTDFYPKPAQTGKVLLSYFDNLETIKASILYSLHTKNKEIRSIVPSHNFFHDIGREFVSDYVIEKNKRNIKTIALWEDIPNKSVLTEYYKSAQIRQLPINMHNSFETTIFIYDDKTLYISPKKDHYAVLIQSAEHAKMMTVMFDTIWIQGTKV